MSPELSSPGYAGLKWHLSCQRHGAGALAVDDVTIAPAEEEPTGAEMLAVLLATL